MIEHDHRIVADMTPNDGDENITNVVIEVPNGTRDEGIRMIEAMAETDLYVNIDLQRTRTNCPGKWTTVELRKWQPIEDVFGAS